MRALLNTLLVAGIDLVRHDQVLDMAKDGTELVRNHQAEVTAHGVDTAAAADLALEGSVRHDPVGPVDQDPEARAEGACALGDLPEPNGPVYARGEGGSLFRLGFQEKDVRCEGCGTGWSSKAEPHAYSNHNYYWNAAVGTRAFWTSRQDNGRAVGRFESCPAPFKWKFKADAPGFASAVINHVNGDRICALPDDIRFLGESCTHKSQCTHLSPWLDLTCAPSTMDAEGRPSEPKCMYVEDADGAWGGEMSDSNTCECTGFFDNMSPFGAQCTNDQQCYGNQCFTHVADGKLRCRAKPDKSQCSNCRASKPGGPYGRAPCQHPDGIDIWTVHTGDALIKQGMLPLKKVKAD